MNWLAWGLGFIALWLIFFFLVNWYLKKRDERIEREEQEENKGEQ